MCVCVCVCARARVYNLDMYIYIHIISVCVCVCVYNLSVGRQVYSNLEIIVVDDGSSDARYRLLSQIQYTRTSREGVTQLVNVTVLHMQVYHADVC